MAMVMRLTEAKNKADGGKSKDEDPGRCPDPRGGSVPFDPRCASRVLVIISAIIKPKNPRRARIFLYGFDSLTVLDGEAT